MTYKMNRGVSQSLYKYLPESWIDFSARSEGRRNYIAHVVRWNSERLEGINKQRLLRVVNHAVKSFASQAVNGNSVMGQATIGYGTGLTTDDCQVLTPKHGGDERGIVAEISPLTFYCQKCHRVHQFKSSKDYYNNSKCKNCHIELSQIRTIYYCKCGWASDKHNTYCPKCKNSENITWSGTYNDYNFYCRKCHCKIPMVKTCDQCSNRCNPKIALDPSQYFACSLGLIDIIDEKVEKFISDAEYGSIITVAYWLGMITREQLYDVINKGINSDPEIFNEKYLYWLEIFKPGMGETQADTAARIAANNDCGSEYNEIVRNLRSKIITAKESLDQLAEMILEYSLVCSSKDCSSLADAIEIARLLNTNAQPELFQEIAHTRGISHTQVCGKIPFISCSYGFTRDKLNPEEGARLQAFKEEQHGVKNIYAAKLDTEGVVFEFDRKRIIEWLLKNDYIAQEDAPDLSDEQAVKLWFINNVRPELIKPFSKLDPNVHAATYYIYNLIHTLSHLLIRGAADMCGLDKNSISEYIMPGIPAVLIYCQNSQGFNLGTLFNVFEAHFDKWIDKAYSSAQKCIFDPICLERYGACTGCLFLNEISCQHFNHDLNRAMVIGKIDRVNNKRQYGFWEE